MLRVRVNWTGPSAPLVSTHYFMPATEDTPAATNSHIAVATFWFAARAHIHTGFSYNVSPLVDRMTNAGEIIARLTAANAAASSGTNAGDPLPPQTQGVVSWHSGTFVAGVEIRGRTFIPGPTETDNSSGNPVSTYLTDIAAAAAAMIADANSILGVWSKTHTSISNTNSGIVAPGWRVLRGRR